ncbi:ORF6N domain-containing protein [Brevibacillus reuszeri]
MAESYGTESQRIQNNFNENRARFSEGAGFSIVSLDQKT